MDRTDPRSVRSRQLLLDAARGLLGERGPTGVTVEAVATRAGVARSTVYRHYPRLPDLLADAVAAHAPPGPPVDTGSVADDVTEILSSLDRALRGSPWAELLPALLLGAEQDPHIAEVLAGFVAQRRDALVNALLAGQARGELSGDTDADTVSDLLAGAVYYRRLLRRTAAVPGGVRALVDSVLPPLRRTADCRRGARADGDVSRSRTDKYPAG